MTILARFHRRREVAVPYPQDNDEAAKAARRNHPTPAAADLNISRDWLHDLARQAALRDDKPDPAA